MKKLTNIVFMWQEKNGDRRWDAISEDQMEDFLHRLIDREHVDPRTLIIGYNPIIFHWVEPQYHTRGLSDVFFGNINEEISGFVEPYSREKENEREISHYNKRFKTNKKIETKFGWLSPDGRYFHCEYFEHSALADKIVGSFNNTDNPERFLEINGWVKIVKGHGGIDTYDIIMGEDKKLTNEQFKVLDRMGLTNCWNMRYYN